MPQEGGKTMGYPKALWVPIITMHSYAWPSGTWEETCKEKGLPSLLLASRCNRRILPKCRSEDLGAVLSYTDVLLNSLRRLLRGRTTLNRKKRHFVFFFFNCGENMRPTFLTSSEGYSMAFYLWGRTSCKSSILSQNSCCCSSSGGLNSHWNHSKRRCVTGEESARKSPSSTLTSCCLMVSWKSHSRGELILASLTNHIIKLWSVFSS